MSAAAMTPAEAAHFVFVHPNGARVMASDTHEKWANDPFYEPRLYEAMKSANGLRTNGFRNRNGNMHTCPN